MQDKTFQKYKLVVDEWFINGFNGTKAYQKYYPKATYESADVSVRQLLEKPRIKDYMASKSKNVSEKAGITLEGQLSELDRLKGLAEKDKKYSDAINALKEQNKLLALYKEHQAQKGEGFSIPITTFFKTIVLGGDK